MSKLHRFAFAITKGPNAGLAVAGWRIWTHREDTYIALKGNPWKASLHGDASWRVAVTSEHHRSGNLPQIPGGRATSWEFEPTSFKDGGRLAFVVAVTRNSLIRQPIDHREHVVEVADRWDRLTALYVWMTEPNVSLEAATAVGGPLPLDSGRRVWITLREDAIQPYRPETEPAGLIVEPRSPDCHDVAAPGFLVRGLHLSDPNPDTSQ